MVANRNNNWQTAKLGDIVDLFDHKRIPLNSRERSERHGIYPYYGAQGIIDYIDGYIFDGRYILAAEDGENLNSKKMPLALFAEGKFWVNNHAHILRGKSKIVDDTFLLACLNNANIKPFVTGAAQPKLSQANLRLIEIPFPPLPLQRKIAGVLSAYDDLIENNNRRIKILEEMAQTIYDEWFVKFRFPGHSKVKMVDSELGKIPEGWKSVTVKDVFRRLPSGKKYDNKSVLPKGNTPVLDQGKSGIIGYHNNEPDIVASEESPIIVFANHTCYQRLVMFPFSAIQNVIPLLPSDDNQRDIIWLHWATKDLIKFNDYKGHYPEFETKRLVLPTPEVCLSFGEAIKPMVVLQNRLDQKNRVLQESRDILLPRLISGEIDVEDVDIDIGDVNDR